MDSTPLPRCTKCVLPSTVPCLVLDQFGVCRHCRAWDVTQERPSRERLERLVSGLKPNDRGEDCIVALSGGRDSSYVLHYAVKELGLRPAVMTYDWGMLTPTGAANQKKMLDSLRLREIRVVDNVALKRRNIRRNVLAWLHRPALGLVPLFMAGDKHFFFAARTVKQENSIERLFLGITDIEAEDFKEGFCGVRSDSFAAGRKHYGLSRLQRLKLIGFYGKEFLLNPRLINLSIPETLFGFYSSYVMGHHVSMNLFEFTEWNEDRIVSTLQQEYDWQKEPDTTSTWRTGDASAPFVSYVFLTVAGFTENDFLRSNQIRRGVLAREAALDLLREENVPRRDGVSRFCDLVGIDYDFLVDKITSFPKLARAAPLR